MRTAAHALAVVGCFLPGVTSAGFETPPTIEIIELDREVRVVVEADGEIFSDRTDSPRDGRFLESIDLAVPGPLGSEAAGVASQDTDVSAFSVRGSATASGQAVRATAKGVPPGVRASASSDLLLIFTVPVDTEFSLQGSFFAQGVTSPPEGIEPSCLARGSIGITGTNADGQPFLESRGYCRLAPDEERGFLITGTVAADQPINLGFSVSFFGQGDDQIQLEGSGQAILSFTLDLGDEDGDGLLDAWEENAITFAGTDLVIDLPGLGADPRHKDLFVEIDVMAGVPFGPTGEQALQLVAQALAAMPIDNPDGERGINLHIVRDPGPGESVPFEAISGSLDGIFARLDAIRDGYFGNADQRANPAVNAARAAMFRYALWADTITEDSESLSGAAELFGDRFVLAAGFTRDRYAASSNPELLATYALAGVFLHELGHTLGLDHGGQDAINYKPHYLSVMNNAYVMPFDRVASNGLNLARHYVVGLSDFAPFAPTGAGAFQQLRLGEGSLRETVEIVPPTLPGIGEFGRDRLARRAMIYNAASEFDADPVRRIFASVLGFPDWNDSGEIEAGVLPSIDLTRIDPATPADYQPDLRTYFDHPYLRLPIVGGLEATAKGPGGSYRRGVSLAELQSFAAAPTVDRVRPGEGVFRSSFELAIRLVER